MNNLTYMTKFHWEPSLWTGALDEAECLRSEQKGSNLLHHEET